MTTSASKGLPQPFVRRPRALRADFYSRTARSGLSARTADGSGSAAIDRAAGPSTATVDAVEVLTTIVSRRRTAA
ncbi:hypothetical protein [Streptomyces adustus]|uniref:hypothetical protein n=1 Tax=Streptomyces adustus TaxID=1609272 RepID=UPI00371A9B6B